MAIDEALLSKSLSAHTLRVKSNESLKQCRACGIFKGLDKFYAGLAKDGTKWTCKECERQRWASRPGAAIAEKPCIVCGVIKPLNEFVKRTDRSDGVDSCCLACNNLRAKKRRDADRVLRRAVVAITEGDDAMGAILPPGMKVCTSCRLTLPRSAFFTHKRDGIYSMCKSCWTERYQPSRKQGVSLKTKDAGYNWRCVIARKYDLSESQYLEMLSSQLSKCAICGRHAQDLASRLAVDHCHTTGVIRGLLCGSCNPGLGLFMDDVDLLRKAASYLTDNAAILPAPPSPMPDITRVACDVGLKQCRYCAEVKSLDFFHKHKSTKDGVSTLCKKCAIMRQQENKYGCPPDVKTSLFDSQDGRCAICNKDAIECPKGVLHIDHCHKSKIIRGLICLRCNHGLGKFMDNGSIILAAADYLVAARREVAS